MSEGIGGFFPPVVARLLGDISEFKVAMKEAKTEMAEVDSTAGKMGVAGKAGLVALGAAAIAVSAVAVHMASNFDAAMERVHTQAGASQREVDILKDKVLGLAGAVGQSPEKLADGLYHIESAGFRGQVALSMLTEAAKGATIGNADLETVTQAMIATMASGIKGVHGASDAMALLNRTVGIGDMRMQGLASAMGTGILSTAKSAGLAFNDVAAALATITDNATSPDEAATRLRMTFSMMSAPTMAAAKALSSVGMSATSMAIDMRKPDGLLLALEDLKSHMDKTFAGKGPMTILQQKHAIEQYAASLKAAGLSAAQQRQYVNLYTEAIKKNGGAAVAENAVIARAFGGGRTSGAILTLLEQMDRLRSKYHELGNSSERARSYQEAWKATSKQYQTQMHQLGAAVDALMIKYGNLLIPIITKVAHAFAVGAQWVAKHRWAMIALAAVLGGVVVVALAAVTVALWNMAAAALANPVVWIVVAIVAAIALLAIGIYELVKHWHAVWGFIKRISEDVWHALVAGWRWLVREAKHIWKDIADGASDVWNAIVGGWHWLLNETTSVWNDITGALSDAWGAVKRFFERGYHGVVDPIVRAWHWVEHTTQAVWNRISAFFRKWWPLLLVIFAFPIAVIMSIWNHFHKQIEHVASVVWRAIAGFFKHVWHDIVNWAKDAWALFEKYIVGPLQAVDRFIARVWHAIVKFLGKVWDGIVYDVEVAWELVYRYIVAPIERAWRWLERAWGAIERFADRTWHNMLTLAARVWLQIRDRIVRPVEDLWRDVTRWFSRLWSDISTALGNIWHTVETWASGWFDMGVNLVQGLIDGVGHMAGQAVGAVKNLANNMLGAAKSFLGINSPSRVFAEQVGHHVVTGTVLGIVRAQGLATDATRVMARSMVAAASGSLTPYVRVSPQIGGVHPYGPAQYGGAYADGTATVHTTIMLDSKVLYEGMQQEALRHERRNGSNGLSRVGR